MKEYADKQRQSKQTTMKIGDSILVRQGKKNKFTPNFDPKDQDSRLQEINHFLNLQTSKCEYVRE